MRTDWDDKKKVSSILEMFVWYQEMRNPFEVHWRQLGEFMVPRRDFSLNYGPPRVQKRYLSDTTARTSAERLSALLYGYMITPYRPWVRPKITGRDASPLEDKWFDKTQRQMFDRLQSPKTMFSSASHESLLDDVAFGNSVIWAGKSTKGAAFYKPLPLFENYWSENPDGLVDTNFRLFTMRIGQAAQRYPSPKLLDLLEKDKTRSQMIEFVHVVMPREDGIFGSSSTRKPFASIVVCKTTDELSEETGFDQFPYIITRFSKRAGQNYGDGPGSDALPLARVLNEASQSLLRAAELSNDPPVVSMVGNIARLDRRPGGMTNLSAAQLRRLDGRDILQQLYRGGDANLSIEMVRDLRLQIEKIFFIDWMSLSTNSALTATEVNERRDIRLRSMTPIVARGETEKLTAVADRQYYLQQDEFDQPPDSLDGEELAWEYHSPLAQAQQLSALETYERVMAIMASASEQSPDLADEVDIPALAKEAMVSAGMPIKHIRDPRVIAQIREQREEQAQLQQELENAQSGAAALRDAGQGIASIEGVQNAA